MCKNRYLVLFGLCLVFLLSTNAIASVDVVDPNANQSLMTPYIEQNLSIIESTDFLLNEDTLHYDGANSTGIGASAGGVYMPAVRFTPTQGCSVKAIVFFHYGTAAHSGYVFFFNTGTSTTPGAILESMPYNATTQGWYRVDFTGRWFGANTDFWLCVKFNQLAGEYPIGADAGPRVVGRNFRSFDGATWAELTLAYNYNIRAMVKYPPPSLRDVGVSAIRSPGGNHTPNTPMIPVAKVNNFGGAAQTSIPVVCSIVGATGVVRYTDTKTIASLNAGDTTLVTFATWTPTIEERCTVKMRTSLTNDSGPSNDRMTRLTDITSAIYITIGTGTSGSGLYAIYGYYNYSGSNAIYLQSEIGYYGPISHFAYYKVGGTVTSGFDDVRIFMRHTSATQITSTGPLDTTGFTRVYAGRFPFDAVGWMDVTLDNPFTFNNSDNLEIMVLKGPPAITTGYPTWAYTSTSPNYLNRYGYNASVWPTTTTRTYSRPNIRFMLAPTTPPANDFSVQAIHSPGVFHSVNNPMTVIALIKNVGAANQTNVPVICSIVGAGGQLRHFNTQNLTINAGDTARANFTSYTPTITEFVTIIVRTQLTNDTNPINDRMTRITEIGSAILMEGFDDVTFPPAGWTVYNFGATPGDPWARQTSYSHSAPACAYIYYDLPNNDWLITPRIRRTGPNDSLTFWYRNHQTSTSYYETLLVRVSARADVADTAQYTIIGTLEQYNNTTWWRAAFDLSTYGESLYIAFYYKNYNDWGMAVDDVRISGAVSAIEENFSSLPKTTTLNAPKPNPVINGAAKISFNLAQPSKANLIIYDASGRIVKTLVNSYLDKGIYNYNWNGTDDYNRKVAEGIYFYTLKTSNENYTKKMIFTR